MTIWELEVNENYNEAFLIDAEGRQIFENTASYEEMQNSPDARLIRIELGKNGFPDIMNYWVTCGTFIVCSKVKDLIEKHFTNLSVQFFPCICKQYPDVEMWAINVYEYQNVLDISKCECRYSHNIAGEEVINSIKKYSFIEKAFEYDIFKVCLPNRKLVTSLFVSDRFKAIMEENGVTGLNLKPVYSI